MEAKKLSPITVEALIKAPIDKVWKYWSEPKHIMQWCQASEDWHAPYADNDLKTNGKFKTTMAARDGSMSFDFEGVYSNVEKNKVIEYNMADGRKVKVTFAAQGEQTKVTETFDPESENPVEMQKGGWQAILDNFKKHTENN
jgi:uncharacterized protein YndB with AHSA1/START domain